MGRVKCSQCGKLAHAVIEGKPYCLECAPEPTMPVTVEEILVNKLVIEKLNPEKMERPKPWPTPNEENFLPWDMESEKTEKRAWWKRLLGIQ